MALPEISLTAEQGLPEQGESDRYLEKLKSLRYLMIFNQLGSRDRMMALALTNLKKAYPEAYEVSRKELSNKFQPFVE